MQKSLLADETRKCLYLGIIIPHFNYCSETWHFCNKNVTAKLEKVNERALRFVFNEKQMSYCELVDKTGLPSLVNQRLAKMHGFQSDHAPRSIKQLFGHRSSHYDLRGNDILKLPKANTTSYGLKSWRFMAPKLCNSIPDSFTTIRSFKVFKNKI